jgi:acetyl-CoA C-acetyltransferase
MSNTAVGNLQGRPVNIIDGARTPFIKAMNKPGAFTASDLAVHCGNALLARQPFPADAIDEVIVGCVAPGVDEANISRIISLRLGCGKSTPAYTVQRNCASGMQSLDNAALDIATGRADLVLAGGTEAMSHSPIVYNHQMAGWLGGLSGARSTGQKLAALLKFRPVMLKPIIGLLRGLTDPFTGLSMGQTAENLAHRFKITREEMDNYAVRSHGNLARAYDLNFLEELIELIDHNGKVYSAGPYYGWQ